MQPQCGERGRAHASPLGRTAGGRDKSYGLGFGVWVVFMFFVVCVCVCRVFSG